MLVRIFYNRRPAMTTQEIRAQLAALGGDNPVADATIPNKSISFGVRVPDLRNLAKRIAKEDYKGFLDSGAREYFDEQMLRAYVIGYAKDDFDTLLGYFTAEIPYVHDWAVNDALCSSFKHAKKHREQTLKALEPYITSHNEFECRVVAVTLLAQFMDGEYLSVVEDILEKLDTTGYYAMMGVAWAAAEIVCRFPEEGMAFMERTTLDDRTFGKAVQKACESFRVSDEDKERLRRLKAERSA